MQVGVLREIRRQADDLRPGLGEPRGRGRTGPASCAGPRPRGKRSSPRWSAAACPPCPARLRPASPSQAGRVYFERLMLSSRHRAVRGPSPFMRLDPQEVVALALLEERNALGHLGVADDDARLRFGARRAASKAATRASMSLPSTRCTCQPNASKRASSGSNPVTSEAGPSACWLLTSTMPIRLSSFQWPADQAPSQIEPSPSSPSENRQ